MYHILIGIRSAGPYTFRRYDTGSGHTRLSHLHIGSLDSSQQYTIRARSDLTTTFMSLETKNIDRGRNSSCYIALCAKSVGNFTTVTDRQLFGFGNL